MSQFGQRRVESFQSRVETRFWSPKRLSGRVRGQQNCVRTLRRREMKIQNWVRTIPRGFERFPEGSNDRRKGWNDPRKGWNDTEEGSNDSRKGWNDAEKGSSDSGGARTIPERF